jgi:hypothetical protein
MNLTARHRYVKIGELFGGVPPGPPAFRPIFRGVVVNLTARQQSVNRGDYLGEYPPGFSALFSEIRRLETKVSVGIHDYDR